ncbi:MAG TPA: hypothetical protein VFO76_04410 [Candidatus Kapabacteria bacterium]|nr:hypothetical protein [Candidatus Kapabacteria bacterium]
MPNFLLLVINATNRAFRITEFKYSDNAGATTTNNGLDIPVPANSCVPILNSTTPKNIVKIFVKNEASVTFPHVKEDVPPTDRSATADSVYLHWGYDDKVVIIMDQNNTITLNQMNYFTPEH